jgi:ATP/maltotriose-dependent transcriptional regulator MalT
MLDSRARIAMGTGDFASVLQQARLAVAVMHEAGNPGAAAAPMTMCGVALMCQGQLPQALVELQAARERAHRYALVSVERGAILNLVPTLLGLGRGPEALACLEEGYALSPSFRGPAEQQAFLEARYQCRVDQGELGAALAVRPDLLAFSARVGEAPRRHSGQLVALDLPLLLGDLALAAPLAEQVLSEINPSSRTT